MDGSISIKPPAPAGKSLAARDPVTVREATELDRSKTVTPAGNDSRNNDTRHNEQRSGDQRGDHPDHPPPDLLADPESREVIYRERDVRAADRAHPDQALLRQRAYRPAPAAADDSVPAPPPDPHADLKA